MIKQKKQKLTQLFLINRLFQSLTKNKQDKGFTLIELLVVILVLSALSLIAYPTVIAQTGKARETEFKNVVGVVNRAQLAYYLENSAFRPNELILATNNNITDPLLGININVKYLDSYTINLDGTTGATVITTNNEAPTDGTRAYSGAIYQSGGNYSQIICQSDSVAINGIAPSSITTCPTNFLVLK